MNTYMWRTFHLFVAGVFAVVLISLPTHVQASSVDLVATLQAKRIELQRQLQDSAFAEPLFLSSREGNDRLDGDLYAEIKHPFAEIGLAFKSPAVVCEWLFLHLNIHACQAASTADGETLTLTAGPRRAFVPGMLYNMTYAMRVEAAQADYLKVTLSADQGPLSTRDYQIVFEVMPIDVDRSFVHFGYSYSYGSLAKVTMQLYQATAGRAKVGFTVLGRNPEGLPLYVRGERASLERNVMRNYLALLAYVSVKPGSVQEKKEARLRAWFVLSERYAVQLHEIEMETYLSEKHADMIRVASSKK